MKSSALMRRAAIALPLALAAWWFLLKGASLWLLRVLAIFPLGMLTAPGGIDPVRIDALTGEWIFNIAVDTVRTNPQSGERQAIESVEFAGEPDNVAFFASGWFSYLALAFSAVGFSRGQARRLAVGMGLQTAINVLSLAVYAYVNGHGMMAGSGGSVVWLLKYVYHIIYLVVPFAGPFGVALLVHPEWRAYFSPPVAQCSRGL